MRNATDLALLVMVCGVAACGGSSKHGTTPGTDGGSTTDGGGSDGGTTVACAPGASCTVADKSCLGLVDNSGTTTFGLRMAQLTFTHPSSFTKGIIATTLAGAVTPALTTCNLDGSATFSWLLQFDTTGGTLTTGGAKPVADPTTGYAFDSETISGFMVQPAMMAATLDATGNFAVATGVNLNLPIFLNAAGTASILLPIQQARLTMGTVSSSHNCIGSYNAANLDPANNCQPTSSTPAFVTGGKVDGFIRLTDADQVTVAPVAESLCVLLSGDAATYGDGASPIAHCKTDAGGAILFAGDWCSTTNAAATASCADSVQLSGDFAASSVKIN